MPKIIEVNKNSIFYCEKTNSKKIYDELNHLQYANINLGIVYSSKMELIAYFFKNYDKTIHTKFLKKIYDQFFSKNYYL